mmetsp:Transcript_15585/g.41855  ORF Transcript_15585/g.41855 Transcript_15585/m.41855 type:complete len:275 (-) Transcript_15585:1120-1944(-)
MDDRGCLRWLNAPVLGCLEPKERGIGRVVRLERVGVCVHQGGGPSKIARGAVVMVLLPVVVKNLGGMLKLDMRVAVAEGSHLDVLLAGPLDTLDNLFPRGLCLDRAHELASILLDARIGHIAVVGLRIIRQPSILHGADVVPARLELRLEVPEEPAVAVVECVELLEGDLLHGMLLIWPRLAHRACAVGGGGFASGAERRLVRERLVRGCAGLVCAHVGRGALDSIALDHGVPGEVVVEAVEPHGAVVRGQCELADDDGHDRLSELGDEVLLLA